MKRFCESGINSLMSSLRVTMLLLLARKECYKYFKDLQAVG